MSVRIPLGKPILLLVCSALCVLFAACGGGGASASGGGSSAPPPSSGSPPPQLANNRTNFVRTDDTTSSAVYDPVHNLVFASEPNLGLVDAISVPGGQIVTRISVPGVLILSVSPDGTRILASTTTQQVAWIDTAFLRVVQWQILPKVNDPTITGPQYWSPYDPNSYVDGGDLSYLVYLGSPAILSNGKVLLFGLEGGYFVKLFLWDPVANTASVITQNAPLQGGGMAPSADGTKVFLFAGPEIYDTATGTILPSGSPESIDMAAANPNGTQFAWPNGTEIKFVDAQFNIVGKVSFSVADVGFVTNIVYSPDGKFVYVVMAGTTPVIVTIDAQSFKVLGNAPAYYDPNNADVPLAADTTGFVFGSVGGGLILDDATDFQSLEPGQESPPINGNIQPTEGPVQGGITTTVANPLSEALADVWFGSQLSTSESLNTLGILAIAPPATSPGVVNVKIMEPNGVMDMFPQTFTYGSIPLSTFPTAGTPNGGTIADIFGFGFSADVTGAAQQVTIGGNIAKVTSAIQALGIPRQILTVTVPPGAPGSTDIVVSSPTGMATFTKGYHYLKGVTDYPTTDTLQGILYDGPRQQLYLSAGDHIDVFSLVSDSYAAPIKPPTIGGSRQMTGMALTPDGSKLIVGNYSDSSVAIINPDSPASASVVQVTAPPISGNSYGPEDVVTTSQGTAFINLATSTDIDGAAGLLFELNLATGAVTKRTDPVLDYLSVSGNPLGASADGSIAYLAIPDNNGGEVLGWTALSDTWQMRNLGGGFDIFLDDGAVSRDGNLFAINNEFDISNFPYPMLLDSQLNVVSQLGIESFFSPINFPGMAVHDSGSLLYSETDMGIDLIDVPHGLVSERIVLNEQATNRSGSLAIDDSGQGIFLVTNSGLTVVELDNVPLSIGSITPSTGTAGTSVKLRGSGFQVGTTVTFNGIPVTATYIDGDTLQLTVPGVAAGPAQAILKNPTGDSYTLDCAFTVQ